MGLDAVRSEFRRLMDLGGPFNIQLSGGEPTMRDDLPEIIAIGREEGFSFFQLNTNGLRIAREPDYLLALKDAGLSCVYLQFDSFDDSHNVALRGRKMLRERMAAIANCRKASIGCVLVPTVVHGINDGMLGAILSFAMGAMPYVRGVHFQPASVFGRYALPHPQKRLTIPKMLSLIEEQTGAQMLSSDFLPGGAESSYCSFHANYLVEPGKGPVCLSKKGAPPPSSAKSRDAVAENWTLDGLEAGQEAFCCDNGSAVLEGEKTGREEQAGSLCETGALDEFLRQRKLRTLTVSGMLFMDAWTFDADRARQCHIAEA
jgi:uncharacterized radical SAM superfamily Fe-S cluster-containing enzyme